MSAVHRTPYDHALHTINLTEDGIRAMVMDGNRPARDLDGPTAVGILTARSNLAIASALLAVADVLRHSSAQQD
ncbi:hypothetical protein [Streptomyces sp. YPW6]|uniref:hypothetical protein n=1 Tax=Streptomyces sp. YPW6 TaxID=2840373 RepID=UPI003D73B1F2